jgi:hypothetical protein
MFDGLWVSGNVQTPQGFYFTLFNGFDFSASQFALLVLLSLSLIPSSRHTGRNKHQSIIIPSQLLLSISISCTFSELVDQKCHK